MDASAGSTDAPDGAAMDVAAQVRRRLTHPGADRLGLAAGAIIEQVFGLIDRLDVHEPDLDAVMMFLTDVGYATDAKRQEWVLLADVFGLTSYLMDRCHGAPDGATPTTLRGPFYRPDAPAYPSGSTIARAGTGPRLAVTVTVQDCDKAPVPGAQVDVWHANAQGRYENQDPDNQPEHNLRGKLVTDANGQCHFLTERPGGYTLPSDGPVGQLAQRLRLSLVRPAHIHFAVTAPGCVPLVTTIFDGADPAIHHDALFAVKPGLIAQIVPAGPTHRADGVEFTLDVVLTLLRSASPDHATRRG